MARHGPIRADGRLSRRIALTVAALAVLYAGLVAALLLAGVAGVIAGLVAVAIVVFQTRASDDLLLRAVDAHEVDAGQAPELHAIVDRLCLQADLPRPRLAISSSPMPNALAVGGLGQRPTVCVDQKLIDLLEPAELEGVVAHELAHIAHRDVLVMTVASFFSVVAALLARLARFGIHGFVRGIALLAAVVVWALSAVLLRALSRYRELAADRTAARLTGRPEALASALMKLDGAVAQIPVKDLRGVQPISALGIIGLPGRGMARRLMADHPDTARRVALLRRMSDEQYVSG